ncbi:oxidoreductase [Mucilaginibacter celer]|uniref:SDR family NAD(P)-dependent oxidoreductase n=1 Tax=Mucilaginibacter celer TaxID=2305508 RepID=A0A494VSK1_9SPHI|nr:oxidoreductase [Mucilaginibacter celer]AYL94335.1 SDR family NAD(P)-dependent oxidoreductase [Mucilaginibacter celer]
MEKVWFITGAGKGFGLEIAKAALSVGDKVIATLRKTGSELESVLKDHKNLLILRMDVTNELQVKLAVDEGINHFGKIDIVVNNAGFGLISSVEEASDKEARGQFDTNVFGILNVSRAVLPYLRKQRSGHVINISAYFAFGTIPGWGIYSATKFAVEGLSEAMAMELNPLGIQVTVVEPGMFRTNFLDESSFVQADLIIEDYDQTSGKIKALTSQFNGAQPGDPSKLGQALLKLVNLENPPVHLPLGKDCLDFYEKNKSLRENEMVKWKEMILSTDF